MNITGTVNVCHYGFWGLPTYLLVTAVDTKKMSTICMAIVDYLSSPKTGAKKNYILL